MKWESGNAEKSKKIVAKNVKSALLALSLVENMNYSLLSIFDLL